LPSLFHRARSAAVLSLLAVAAPVLADTSVYVTNLTGEPLTIDARNVAGGLAQGAWSRGAGTIAPGERAAVLRFSRGADVENGVDYIFTTDVRAGDAAVQLRQLMRGRLARSKLLWSLSGPGVDHPWLDERGAQTASVTRARGDRLVVTYGAYATGGDDDIEYVVARGEDLPQPPVDNPDSLAVLAWNVQLLPEIPLVAGTQRAQAERVWRIGRALSNGPAYDVVVVSEAFDDRWRDNLAQSVVGRYPYRTKVVGRDRGLDQDGGVMILSRWPIEQAAEAAFGGLCNGDDCRADKGVIYARIRKAGRRYHVLGTHTQAAYQRPAEPVAVSVRASQFALIRRFVDQLRIPGTEPVVVAGDLNVNGATRQESEYRDMLATLGAVEVVRTVPHLSSDPQLNGLTGRNEGVRQMLDYVLPLDTHLMPVLAETRVVHARAATGYEKRLGDFRFQIDLSDHFPVLGVFQYPARQPGVCELDPAADGCRPPEPDACTVGPQGPICR
jgi:endonuclease/exonuclease/phosphatase family metal-dependent hydrolase